MLFPLKGALSPLAASSGRPPSTLLQGLRSWWECDEASGVRVDAHASNDLTSNNSVGSATGLVHPLAANFVKASSQFLSHAATAGIDIPLGQDFSVAGIVFFNSDLALNDGLWTKGGDPTGELTIRWRAGAIPFRMFAGTSAGTAFVDLGNGTTLNAWHMVYAHRRTSAGVVRAGGAVDAGTLVESTGTAGTATRDTTVGIRLGSSSSSFFWSGRIGPWALWDRVLTAEERTEFWNGGAGMAYPG